MSTFFRENREIYGVKYAFFRAVGKFTIILKVKV